MDTELQAVLNRLVDQHSWKLTPPNPSGFKILQVGDVMGECPSCYSPAIAQESDVKWQKDRIAEGEVYDYTKQYCLACRDRRKKAQDEENLRRFYSLQKRSGIGARFINNTWDDFIPPNAQAAKIKTECQAYAQSFTERSCDIVMVGSCGTGKNMISSLIGLDIMRNGYQYEYTTAMRLVREVKDSWRDREVSEQSVIDGFLFPTLLAIDEIGVQFGSATEQLYINEVINNRYEAMKPTILISNLTVPQVEEVLGKRAVDRFHENGKFLVFNWESYRRRK